jgi:hypothetical protein
MNKLLIILLFLPLFADAQIGLLLRPLDAGGIDTIPSTLPGLVQWLRADTFVITTGTEVDNWNALVVGRNFQDFSNKPDYYGSGTTAYIDFPSNDILYRPAFGGGLNLYGNERTVILVIYSEGTSGFIYNHIGVSSDGGKFQINANASIDVDGGLQTFTSSDIPLNEWCVLRAQAEDLDASSSIEVDETRLYVNGSESTITVAGNNTTINTTTTRTQYLAGGPFSGFWTGRVKEVIVYNRILSSVEITALQNYFNTRYSITF